MADLFALGAPELAALLCSRVCHDIISPVGAINNGLELLDEGGADEDAMRLIRQSARNASARLQYMRIAFGAAGSAGMQIDTGDAETVAAAYFKNEKPELTWQGGRALLPKNKVKLILNLLLIANATIPRGGRIAVELADLDGEARFTMTSSGPMVRVPPKFLELHSGQRPEEPIDAHSVQPYYTLLLAQEAGMVININATPEQIVLSAVAKSDVASAAAS
ncbi:histidine phosphotransferase family protein [Mesorhizobium sp. RP14(2022)]|uniref:Histidine phosphotransferase family protein n=1 Tax=Mesorhizobium liriopis TaxID=2953882 RepID=A0ABT1C1V4_9HYPH|nr:histidine phosphotransferase family protein [Mesorhizobium liriopis]MCO6048774.1 histidine phosphotransferase family protein [Mesorhizobium liriopis]